MRILVTGSSGMLGREMMEVGKKKGHEMVGWTRSELDLEKPEEGIRRIAELKPGAVIHCAAETNVDRCEREPELAMRVNGETPGKLAAAAREAGAQFIFISTSGIFGGEKEGPFSEEEPPRPGTAYAKAKVFGEERVRKEHPQALILRAGWLFGGPLEMKKNFVGARLREAEGKEVIQSATDKRGSPTWTRDFAERALELLEKKTGGWVHLVNAGGATRQEYVAEILRLTGRKTRVEGVDSSAFARSAPVPADERLASSRDGKLRSWKEAVADYLRVAGC